MRLRILTDLFRQKFVCKTLKYTKYSCEKLLFPTKNLRLNPRRQFMR